MYASTAILGPQQRSPPSFTVHRYSDSTISAAPVPEIYRHDAQNLGGHVPRRRRRYTNHCGGLSLCSLWWGIFFVGVVAFLIVYALLNTHDPTALAQPHSTPPLPPAPPSSLTADSYHKRIQESRTTPTNSRCPVGYRPTSASVCERNLYWPDPCDRSMQDEDADPCVDFFQYACGSFARDQRNQGTDATFRHLYQSNREVLHTIVRRVAEQQEPDESRVSAFYHSCVQHQDHDLRSPTFALLLQRIDALQSYAQLPALMGKLQLYDTILPIELSFELDPLRGRRLIPLLQQGGLFVEEPAQLHTAAHADQVAKRMQRLFPKASESAKRAKHVVLIEQSLAAIRYETSASNLIEYVLESDQFEKHDLVDDWSATLSDSMTLSGFNLTLFLESARPADYSERRWLWALHACPLWVRALSYMERFAPLVRTHSLSAWRNYLRHAILFHLVNDGAPRIDPSTHYAYHRSYDARYSLPWQRPRRFLFVDSAAVEAQEECVFVTEAYLPVLLDNYFLSAELDADTRTAAAAIAERVRTQFLKLLHDRFRYLTDEERSVAERKLKGVHFQIGAPDKWPLDRSDLRLDPESFSENVLRVRYYHVCATYKLFASHLVEEADSKLDPDELFDGLVSVANAFYQHQLNTVTVNAGLLQPPVFSRLYDDVAQMARLGVFLAHELAHSIDRIGANFDADGALRPWLGSTARGEFQARMQCFVNLYDRRTSLGNQHDGVKTLNENVADITGFRVAWDSLFHDDQSASSRYQQSAVVTAVDRKREFFLAYAQLYCESLNAKQERQMISRHTHATGSMRVNNVVMQHEEFADTWQCSTASTRRFCDIL